jgi:hypothetical protein
MNIYPPEYVFWIICGVCGILATIRTILNVKRIGAEEKALEPIKNDLINLDKYQREVATNIAKQPYYPSIMEKIQSMLGISFPLPTLLSTIIYAKRKHPEQLFDLYQLIGNVMDDTIYGLNKKLEIRDSPYSNTLISLTSKVANLQMPKKKRGIISENCKIIRNVTYGLNSSIIYRKLLKLSYAKEKDKFKKFFIDFITTFFQRLENTDNDFLTNRLLNLDKKKEYKPKIDIITESQIITLCSLISKLDKTKYKLLYELKEMIEAIVLTDNPIKKYQYLAQLYLHSEALKITNKPIKEN